MTTEQTASIFANIFPTADAIPENAKLDLPIKQAQYLINGEFRTWTGEFTPIYLRY
ncbi:MAG: hypothetical protein IPP60_00005, partial [Sphingobacteriales bacterium]|nr:hypothetical protein [Sphingobacteriales bacterium]